jgi:hypothetical protein
MHAVVTRVAIGDREEAEKQSDPPLTDAVTIESVELAEVVGHV